MFEGTLVESRGLVASGTQKWTAVGSLTVQCAVMGLLLAIPLLRPEVLHVPLAAPRLVAPYLPKPVIVEMKEARASSAATVGLPSAGGAAVNPAGPSIWPHPGVATGEGAPTVDLGRVMGPLNSNMGDVLGGSDVGRAAVTVVREKAPGPVRVSTGVSEGLLLEPIRAVYPAIAKAAGVQGAVVVEAMISKAGRVESLQAVSGPMLLTRAALEAVAAARYRPYLLNGEATEVKTTFTVVFQLGS
ncbi:MAG TPA: energy transducer TonB [Acidobacteriaceae bacterium]|nr:energy transducer TonB [Acidobacteriaceae bacterium]